MPEAITINKNLLWDYDFKEDEMNSELFIKWYIARVLISGTGKDVAAVGLYSIKKYLPELIIPHRIKEFWQWYLKQTS